MHKNVDKKSLNPDIVFERNVVIITGAEIGANSINKTNNNEYKILGFAVRKNNGKFFI